MQCACRAARGRGALWAGLERPRLQHSLAHSTPIHTRAGKIVEYNISQTGSVKILRNSHRQEKRKALLNVG